MKKKIDIYLRNGFEKKISVVSGTIVNELLSYLGNNEKYIAAKVNNEVTSLSYPIKVNSTVEYVNKKDFLGMEVYKRSLSFLLEKVVLKLFPDRRLVIGHSLGPGYYFDLEGRKFFKSEVRQIENAMKREVEEDKPIYREKISYADALKYFKTSGREDKYKLLSSLNISKLSIYRCDDFFQVVDLPLASHTGVLDIFKLIYYFPGFILQFPKKSIPNKVSKFTEQRKIFEVYREYREWGKTIKVDNIGSLNKIILDNKINNFIQMVELLHTKKIMSLAEDIYKRRKKVKLICIAGPSSSGKTTFSKRLALQLNMLGLNPTTISVDNYFVDRNKTPLDISGNPNYESIRAINTKLLNDNLSDLLNNKEIKLPFYNFHTGVSSISDKTVSIGNDDIIIIEGIHCLNEKLTYIIPKDKKYKIYVSVITQMNIDNNNRIPTTDNRLIRRLVRDYKYRGHSAKKTFEMWPSVRNGEEEYIFPFQNDADGYFNSALDFELALLKPQAETILMQIKPSDKEYAGAMRLLKFLSYFITIQPACVPSTSIIREFIGGSYFRY